ncbi:sensor histidine kinase [Streptomyces sp. HNM0575]|uniref:sensor histidine kinase n=1 Tax=Streptomyces sp. HNM0575 TaxID=2716338 RepID=UPI00145CAA19|nr:histidine kinase [Streptomyces sp. HNM0575]NLU75809.1 sensor histidine kinase [Streptomyces sp. HNM0575]
MTETGERPDVGGPWWWERRRSVVLDVTLTLVSAVECAVQGVDFADEAGLPAAAGVVLGLVAGSTLVLRRRWPIAVVLVAVALAPAEMGFVLGFVGLYSLAVAPNVPRRITVLLTGMQAAAAVITTVVRLHQSIGQDPGFNPPWWFIPLMSVVVATGVTAPPVLMGLYVGARRRLVVSLRERADGLERELALLADRAEERAEWARSEERTRIAREMHDVVAHRVSLMVVHAAALQAVALKDPEKASKNAALVGDMGRQALTELRTMLGVLRSPEGGGERAAGSGGASVRLAEFAVAAAGSAKDGGGGRRGAGASSGEPGEGAAGSAAGSAGGAGGRAGAGAGTHVAAGAGPGAALPEDVAGDAAEEQGAGDGPRLAELGALVGQSREAGMSVDFSVDGSSGGYGAGVEQTAFRVVQEALTNVHKHAPGARTRVRLAHREGEVAVQVENERPVDGEGAAGAGLPSGGNGLVGMKERVTALGGGFVSGPTDVGGFRVSAVIPAGRSGAAGPG